MVPNVVTAFVMKVKQKRTAQKIVAAVLLTVKKKRPGMVMPAVWM